METWLPDHPGLVAVLVRLRGRDLPLFASRPWVAWDAALRIDIIGDGLGPLPAETGVAVRAGLHLWNDGLAESHALSQQLATATGAYWHGLMHRREGDLDNAAYWFRRVGDHPVFPAVQAQALIHADARAAAGDPGAAAGLADLRRVGLWDPFAFLTWCRAGGEQPWLAEVAAAEIDCVLAHNLGVPGFGRG